MIKVKVWAAAAALIWTQTVFAEVLDVTIHYVGPTEGSAWLGVQQGISEANLQGEFLGQTYTIKQVKADGVAGLENVSAVLVAGDVSTIENAASSLSDIPVFNLSADDDALRAACLPNLLNIPASQQMKQDASKQWLAKNPESTAHIQGWHEDFKKFAASQLNSRFTKSHGTIMDDTAWSGWAAVKMISDTVARTQSDDGTKILDYLKNDITFDGQKGAGATFRETGQLRQLVLVVENNKIVAEAPLRGVKGGLDSLGLLSCKK
ncbi:hypothetical protein A9Q92_06225 [Methylophaga sp. 42_8_T64]|nr:hypothetical protein A9Q78_10140 [Methylophaga sp. 41_12_T18]OUR86217.1 hypothetical protein A9Q92_06225 [Methylophaga sp. 42_8_T64]